MNAFNRIFSVDTLFVVIFLAMDMGQNLFVPGIGTLLSLITLLMFMVLPYYLPSINAKPEFMPWMFGRVVAASTGLAIGATFHFAVGSIVPSALTYFPFVMLIAAGMISLYIQLGNLIRPEFAE